MCILDMMFTYANCCSGQHFAAVAIWHVLGYISTQFRSYILNHHSDSVSVIANVLMFSVLFVCLSNMQFIRTDDENCSKFMEGQQ